MATNSLLLVPFTLCIFLLVLPAQAVDSPGVQVTVSGIARCKINPSMLIRNASLHLCVDKTTVPGVGWTTETGQIVLTANLTSSKLLDAMLRNSTGEAFVVAPSHACGAPRLPSGTVLGAPVKLTAVITGKASGSEATPISGQLAIAGATSEGLLIGIIKIIADVDDALFSCVM
ncbi:hypothetical protein ACP4OV_007177 [Aristida adscensionis]